MLALPGEQLPGQKVLASDSAAMLRHQRNITSRSSPGSLVVAGSGGVTRRPVRQYAPKQWPTNGAAAVWPFKVYNTSAGPVGQVQINGGDGFVGSINGMTAKVNGNPIDTATGSPAAYPQLAISGNGAVYVDVSGCTSSGAVVTVGSVDVLFATSLPPNDTANPFTFEIIEIATISNYGVDSSGNVTFNVNNTTNTGFSQLISCNSSPQVY